jgi:hypothetical protein
MRDEALFINGIFESVLEEILEIQGPLPDQILFLQPYAGSRIAHFVGEEPTTADPVRLYLSTSTALGLVAYQAEVVGWSDKTKLSNEERSALNRIIWSLQPHEHGLYDKAKRGGPASMNLLHIRRLNPVKPRFKVRRLSKTSNGTPLAKRTTSGGWAYVHRIG